MKNAFAAIVSIAGFCMGSTAFADEDVYSFDPDAMSRTNPEEHAFPEAADKMDDLCFDVVEEDEINDVCQVWNEIKKIRATVDENESFDHYERQTELLIAASLLNEFQKYKSPSKIGCKKEMEQCFSIRDEVGEFVTFSFPHQYP